MSIRSILRSPLREQWRNFEIAIADTDAERRLAWRIRHDVFLAEMQGKPRADGMERDDFDDAYDHVVVRIAATGEPVGTCRMVSSSATENFYSASEFSIDRFLELPGTKIELGRVCLCPAWRNNLALAAIGRAIGWYAQAHEAAWIFGCTSVTTVNPVLAGMLNQHFITLGACAAELGILPVAEYRLPDLQATGVPDIQCLDALIPPLMRLYLKSGARLGCEPAIDREFGCLDFFTMVDLTQHRKSILSRYVPC